MRNSTSFGGQKHFLLVPVASSCNLQRRSQGFGQTDTNLNLGVTTYWPDDFEKIIYYFIGIVSSTV